MLVLENYLWSKMCKADVSVIVWAYLIKASQSQLNTQVSMALAADIRQGFQCVTLQAPLHLVISIFHTFCFFHIWVKFHLPRQLHAAAGTLTLIPPRSMKIFPWNPDPDLIRIWMKAFVWNKAHSVMIPVFMIYLAYFWLWNKLEIKFLLARPKQLNTSHFWPKCRIQKKPVTLLEWEN